MAIRIGCHVFSSHGVVLFYIAANPDCCVADIAETMCLTRRSVRSVIGDLRRAGMLRVRKEGHRHHYTVNLDTPFLHPTLADYTPRPILGETAEQAGHRTSVP